MLFNSHLFIFAFLPLALALFFGLGRFKDARWALGAMAGASVAFYAYWDWRNLRVILPSLVLNYVVGGLLTRQPALATSTRSWLIKGGVLFNLTLLGYYKYTDFALQSATTLTGMDFALRHIALPLGISFFTFEQIAFIVDSYRHQSRHYGFLEYCFFVTFFPHLIAGPIIQHNELIEQLQDKTRRWDWDSVALGVTIFVLGLFKKVVLADTCATHAAIYDQLKTGLVPTFFSAWLATVAYSLQLYFDFSGYSDMAIGLARMVNVKLPANFNSPYKAHNIIEFWRRWHMTLSRFLRVYLYIPLGGNRGSTTRRYVNLLLTMLLGGLWHGAGWGFVIWGGLNGLYLVVNNLFRAWRGAPEGNTPDGPWVLTQGSTLLTFFCIMMSRVFFRAAGWEESLTMLKSLLGGAPWAVTQGLHTHAVTLALFLVLYIFCRVAPNTQQFLAHKAPVFGKVESPFAPVFQFRPTLALPLAGLAVISLLMLTRVSEFIYFQF